jgi:alkyldihydroxyacetonephosphate synthase
VPASAAGPDLKQMIMGSEGRMGVVTTCKVRITPRPESQVFHGAFLPSADVGMAAVRELAQAGVGLTMMRLSLPRETETSMALASHGLSKVLLDAYLAIRRMDEGRCLLLYGATGSRSRVHRILSEAQSIIKRHRAVVIGGSIGDRWYQTRFHYPYLRNTLWERGYGVDTLETAVPWAKVPVAVQAIEDGIRRSFEQHNEKVHVFTHLSHVYPHGSSIYTSYTFRLADDPDESMERWRTAKRRACKAIVASGGTISHQHGVGHDHQPYLEAEKGPLGLRMIRSVIDSLDPSGVMNTGNLID